MKMKTNTTSLILTAVALSASALTSLSAASTADPAVAYRVSDVCVSAYSGQPVTQGSSRAAVLESMGPPHRTLAPHIWVYYRYHARDVAQADHAGCSSMVVTFQGDAVSDLRLMNKPALNHYAASCKAWWADRVASSK